MKILFKGKDGSVAIMTLAEGADKDDTIQKFKDSPSGENYVDHFEYKGGFPSDREFRDAWTFNKNKIIVDEHKAKQIHMSRIRYIRNKELDKLDKEQLKVLSDIHLIKEIESRKQILRDLPANWDSLKWPSDLLGDQKWVLYPE